MQTIREEKKAVKREEKLDHTAFWTTPLPKQLAFSPIVELAKNEHLKRIRLNQDAIMMTGFVLEEKRVYVPYGEGWTNYYDTGHLVSWILGDTKPTKITTFNLPHHNSLILELFENHAVVAYRYRYPDDEYITNLIIFNLKGEEIFSMKLKKEISCLKMLTTGELLFLSHEGENTVIEIWNISIIHTATFETRHYSMAVLSNDKIILSNNGTHHVYVLEWKDNKLTTLEFLDASYHGETNEGILCSEQVSDTSQKRQRLIIYDKNTLKKIHSKEIEASDIKKIYNLPNGNILLVDTFVHQLKMFQRAVPHLRATKSDSECVDFRATILSPSLQSIAKHSLDEDYTKLIIKNGWYGRAILFCFFNPATISAETTFSGPLVTRHGMIMGQLSDYFIASLPTLLRELSGFLSKDTSGIAISYCLGDGVLGVLKANTPVELLRQFGQWLINNLKDEKQFPASQAVMGFFASACAYKELKDRLVQSLEELLKNDDASAIEKEMASLLNSFWQVLQSKKDPLYLRNFVALIHEDIFNHSIIDATKWKDTFDSSFRSEFCVTRLRELISYVDGIRQPESKRQEKR